jgi:hypothetical protein
MHYQLSIINYQLACWGFAPNPTFFFALMQKRSRLHLLIDPTAACSPDDFRILFPNLLSINHKIITFAFPKNN